MRVRSTAIDLAVKHFANGWRYAYGFLTMVFSSREPCVESSCKGFRMQIFVRHFDPDYLLAVNGLDSCSCAVRFPKV
jgi:hypothetical protein